VFSKIEASSAILHPESEEGKRAKLMREQKKPQLSGYS